MQHRSQSRSRKKAIEWPLQCRCAGDRWVLVADLGNDRIYVYALDSSRGNLTPGPHPSLELPAGSGPRHLSFHPSKKFVYIINETNMTMTAASWNNDEGKLEIVNHASTLPPDTQGDNLSTAEVLVHPNGRFVYGSNRGHDTIVAMADDLKSGAIKRVDNYSTMGKTPRNFRLDPFGMQLLAENQGSDSIFSFKINGGKRIASSHWEVDFRQVASLHSIPE